jgi:hypothetical protein
MRMKSPRIATMEQVRISRSSDTAIIEFLDSSISTTHFRIGPGIEKLSDEDILLFFNQTIAAGIRNRDELPEYFAIEIPPGGSQLDYKPETVNQWVPRGGVLRCYIEDGGGEQGDLPIVYVDDHELSWEDFGRAVLTYAGWGMRLTFVPVDELEVNPKIVVR